MFECLLPKWLLAVWSGLQIQTTLDSLLIACQPYGFGRQGRLLRYSLTSHNVTWAWLLIPLSLSLLQPQPFAAPHFNNLASCSATPSASQTASSTTTQHQGPAAAHAAIAAITSACGQPQLSQTWQQLVLACSCRCPRQQEAQLPTRAGVRWVCLTAGSTTTRQEQHLQAALWLRTGQRQRRAMPAQQQDHHRVQERDRRRTSTVLVVQQ